MFARIAMFGLALLALWMIWRAVRQWIDADAARRDDARGNRRLSHQRGDGSAPWVATGVSADGGRSGVRKGDHSREPEAARGVDAPRGENPQPGGDSHGDSGSGGSGDSGGGGGSD